MKLNAKQIRNRYKVEALKGKVSLAYSKAGVFAPELVISATQYLKTVNAYDINKTSGSIMNDLWRIFKNDKTNFMQMAFGTINCTHSLKTKVKYQDQEYFGFKVYDINDMYTWCLYFIKKENGEPRLWGQESEKFFKDEMNARQNMIYTLLPDIVDLLECIKDLTYQNECEHTGIPK